MFLDSFKMWTYKLIDFLLCNYKISIFFLPELLPDSQVSVWATKISDVQYGCDRSVVLPKKKQ